MPFDPNAVDLLPPIHSLGGLTVRWTTTAPPDTDYQLYVDGKLAWTGKALEATIPAPAERVRITVGAVGPGEANTDFSSSLTPAPKDRATLTWTGGTYLDPSGEGDVAGFRIYGEPKPGDGVNYTRALGDIPIGVDGIHFDGYGYGGYGEGGYGASASKFSWTSPVLSAGVWAFAVRAYDHAGNESTAATASVAIVAPPKPPAFNSERLRLTYEYDPITRRATLKWLPSPD